MRQDRLSSLRQRLKRGSFEFGALLEGVSTLEDDPIAPTEARRSPATRPAEDRTGASNVGAVVVPPHAEPVSRARNVEPIVETVLVEVPVTDQPQAVLGILPEPISGAAEPKMRDATPDCLQSALSSLGCRFLQEVGSLRAALSDSDVEEGGFHLAHLNQVLELLRDLDPEGDIARLHGTMGAPPIGRSWPTSSWTVVEFAASPFSALLPPRADARFASDLVYAAWGVTFEHAE